MNRLSAAMITALSISAATRTDAWPTEWIRGEGHPIAPEAFAEAWGVNPAFGKRLNFSRNATLQVFLVDSTIPANILWPGDEAAFTFQFTNLTREHVAVSGRARVVHYTVITEPGDNVFAISVRKIADLGSVPFSVDVPPEGWQDITLTPPIPERFGGYAVILDIEGQDALFGATCVRTFKPERRKRQFYRLTMDLSEPDALVRLGATVNRIGVPYMPSTDPDFETVYAELSARLGALHAVNLPVCLEFGGGAANHTNQPLGRPRPMLNDRDELQDTKMDWTWMPAWDADFKKVARRLMEEHGWPRGPVNAVKLWNEPWEGISISGWGADMLRYRDIYRALGEARDEAAAAAGVQVLIGGCDSTANTLDKLFPDGEDTFLPWLDFVSIHYQGIDPFTTYRPWVDRLDARGRPDPVQVWDTESWVANSDDRIAGVLAAMLSFGQQRVVGIQSEAVVTAIQNRQVMTDGGRERRKVLQTWPPGAAVGAFQHFVGERPFREMLFRNALPFIMVFDAEPDERARQDPEDGTVVVLGDMGSIFGHDHVLFRNCRSLAEIEEKEVLRAQLASLPADDPERAGLEDRLAKPWSHRDAGFRIPADTRYGLYDFYGNPVPAESGFIHIPLDARGFYLRGNGQPGDFNALLDALRNGRMDGMSPLDIACLDMNRRVALHPEFHLRLTNIRNQPVCGRLDLHIEGLSLEYPGQLALDPQETREIAVRVAAGAERADNLYPLRVVFDAGQDGKLVHHEHLRVNLVHRRTVTIDGQLDDWSNAIPQTVRVDGVQTATLTEKAWLPFLPADEGIKKGLASAYLAGDDDFFYIAVKAADSTPDGGTLRFETRDDDANFYPPTAYEVLSTGFAEATNISVRWSGTVQALTATDYTFSLILRAGGARLWLDDELVIDEWTERGARRPEASPLALKAGQRLRLVLEFRHGANPGGITLCWKTPDFGFSAIHGDRFFTPDGARGIQGEYFADAALQALAMTRVDRSINVHSWPGLPADEDFAHPRRVPREWPEGLRRYSYRKRPVLPSGNAPNFDNVQIAFNVLAADQKDVYPCPPGTMPGYISGRCTDYEYSLNSVAGRYGGGCEVWRLRSPGQPVKNFYPRQPKSPQDGPVRDARLAVSHQGGTRITECAIPWSELPEVKRCMDEGSPFKFSFRVNDSAGVGCLELARGRSVSKRQSMAFSVPWIEHWANEVSFHIEPGTAGKQGSAASE